MSQIREFADLKFPLLVAYQNKSNFDDVFSLQEKNTSNKTISDSTINSTYSTHDSLNINSNCSHQIGPNEVSTISERNENREFTRNASSLTGLDGSPLKLQAIADLSFSSSASNYVAESRETKMSQIPNFGIPINVARIFASWMCEVYQKSGNQLPQLLIFCDGNHVSKIAAIMVEYQAGNVKMLKVVVKGPSSPEEFRSEFEVHN